MLKCYFQPPFAQRPGILPAPTINNFETPYTRAPMSYSRARFLVAVQLFVFRHSSVLSIQPGPGRKQDAFRNVSERHATITVHTSHLSVRPKAFSRSC